MGNDDTNDNKNNKIEYNQFEPIKTRSKLDNIKNKYILKRIINIINKKKVAKIIKYNKRIQNRLNINYIEFAKLFSQIELEIVPNNNYGKFINIRHEDEKPYFHVYFNDEEQELQRYDITEEDKVKKIRIKIDYQIDSFSFLFHECKNIKSIEFKQFNEKEIT